MSFKVRCFYCVFCPFHTLFSVFCVFKGAGTWLQLFPPSAWRATLSEQLRRKPDIIRAFAFLFLLSYPTSPKSKYVVGVCLAFQHDVPPLAAVAYHLFAQWLAIHTLIERHRAKMPHFGGFVLQLFVSVGRINHSHRFNDAYVLVFWQHICKPCHFWWQEKI